MRIRYFIDYRFDEATGEFLPIGIWMHNPDDGDVDMFYPDESCPEAEEAIWVINRLVEADLKKKFEEAKPYLKEIESFELKLIEQKRKRESIPFITEVDGDLTLLYFNDWVLMVMPSYLLGKHSTVSTAAGSKFKDIKYSERLYRVLLEHVNANMRKIRKNVDSGEVIRLPNIDSGYVVGTDSLAELKEVVDESGKKFPFQTTALPLNKPHRGEAKDAAGSFHIGEVSLVLTREKPETFQNIFKSRKNPPATKLINIIMGHLNLQFYPGGETGFKKTSEEVAQLWGKSLEEFDKRILVVFTIFSGSYAPAANPPLSTQVDPFVGETGEAFWRKHCLLQKP